MKNRSYYSFSDDCGNVYNRCSIESCAAPIIVNCAGVMQSPFPFTTDNERGRLDYYLMFVVNGSLTVSLPEGDSVIGAGDALIFPPKFHYRYTSGGGELCYYWCHFTGSDAKSLLHELGFSPLPKVCRAGREDRISGEFEKMFSLFGQSDKPSPLSARTAAHILEGILLTVARHAFGVSKEKSPLSRSVAYVNENYTREIKIPELARMENLSNSRFHVLFCEMMGMPPVRYITKLRIQSACELLLTTDLPVKQVGLAVGYSDPHFFSKTFKAFIGVSPGKYRD